MDLNVGWRTKELRGLMQAGSRASEEPACSKGSTMPLED